MIRLFQTWRAARRKKMCDLVAQIWAECEAELLAEIEAAKVKICRLGVCERETTNDDGICDAHHSFLRPGGAA